MSDTSNSRLKRGGKGSSRSDVESVYIPQQRASRRIAGQRPEVEVIKRSRGLSTPPHANSGDESETLSYGTIQHISSTPSDSPIPTSEASTPLHRVSTEIRAPQPHNSYVSIAGEVVTNIDGVIVIDGDDELLQHPMQSLRHASNALSTAMDESDDVDILEGMEITPAQLITTTPPEIEIPQPEPIQEYEVPSTREDYWSNLVQQLGIKRIRLNLPSEPLETEYPALHAMEEDSEVNYLDDKLSGKSSTDKKSSRKSTSKKKKPSSSQKKIDLTPEEMEETPDELIARRIRERGNELDALVDLKTTINSMKTMMEDQTGGLFARAMASIVSDIFEEVAVEIIQEAHYQIITGSEEDLAIRMAGKTSMDIFGQDPAAIKNESFLCGNMCGRIISSNRYAPHLEKCTGMQGPRARNSRRDGF